MNSRPDEPPGAVTASPPLERLLSDFAAALRARGDAVEDAVATFATEVVDDGLPAAARVGIYRNNARAAFDGALERNYPVLRRRVGEGYFARLADGYRAANPSASGDLHWVGRGFAAWLASADLAPDYRWLVDLARLEWACEESLVAAIEPALDPAALGHIDPADLAATGLRLQPGLRCVASEWPVWSVWQANQPAAEGGPVDPALGAQYVVVTCGEAGLALHSLPRDRFRFVEALARGCTLGDAIERSGLAVESLPAALAWLFSEGTVTGLVGPTGETRS